MPHVGRIPLPHRVRQGDKIRLIVYSSIANVVFARIRILYDDGSADNIDIADFTTGAARGQELVPFAEPTVRKDGVVVDAFVSTRTATAKRGQTYVILNVDLADKLCNGYVSEDHDVVLGENVEAGPAGGEGNFLLNPIVNAVATGADFILDIGPGTNAFWKVHELKIKYKASATVGTRTVNFTRMDEDAVGLWSLANQAPTASQDLDYYFTQALIGERGSVAPVDIAVEIEMDPFFLPEGHILRIEDTADISATDAVTVRGLVEEWIKP